MLLLNSYDSELPWPQLAEKILTLRPDIPIIMCTGFYDSISLEAARTTGITGVLNKPVLTDEPAISIRQ